MKELTSAAVTVSSTIPQQLPAVNTAAKCSTNEGSMKRYNAENVVYDENDSDSKRQRISFSNRSFSFQMIF